MVQITKKCHYFVEISELLNLTKPELNDVLKKFNESNLIHEKILISS